jgi:hypothetical protein
MPDLARRVERTRVVPVCPNSAAPAERAVDALRDAYRHALEAATKAHVSIRFDEQMDVIVLHAEVEHPESIRRRSSDSAADGAEDVVSPERREIAACPECYMGRATAVVECAATSRAGDRARWNPRIRA